MATKKTTPNTHNKTNFVKKEALKFGFETAKENILFFSILIFIVTAVFILSEVVKRFLGQSDNLIINLSFNIITWVINAVVSMGLIKISLDFVDKKKPILSEIVYTKSLLSYLGVLIVKSVIVLIGFILLIIPGIIFSIKLQFSEYLVVDKGLGTMDAIKKSWEITKGVKLNLFLFSILVFLINLLGFLALLLGLFITIPLTWVATAYVYRKLLARA